MAMTFSKIEETVYELALPIVDGSEFFIYDVEFVKEGGNWFLRVFVDKLGDACISLDECENFSRKLSEVLDKVDPINQNYFLEVSSPGIERKVRRLEHFDLNKGEIVDVGLYKSINGSKSITGELQGLDEDDNVILLLGDETIKIPLKQTTVINMHFEF